MLKSLVQVAAFAQNLGGLEDLNHCLSIDQSHTAAAYLAAHCQDLRSQAMWSPTMPLGPLLSLE